MGQTVAMGYVVTVVVGFLKSPNEHTMTALDHQFGAVEHEKGSKTVTVTEHVSIADEADAIAFVRSLVADAVPEGSKITGVSAVPG
ncbi:MAG: hypothetical protein JWN99_684 [Ilumatobacteraceae bacterium]|jgi:hypothetical protein|nr:hypothetical protein [Ilumatobacteraceae bacterium]